MGIVGLLVGTKLTTAHKARNYFLRVFGGGLLAKEENRTIPM